jgi:hypothetical protein
MMSGFKDLTRYNMNEIINRKENYAVRRKTWITSRKHLLTVGFNLRLPTTAPRHVRLRLCPSRTIKTCSAYQYSTTAAQPPPNIGLSVSLNP